MGFFVVGVASTIDNDLYGSEITIGVDTALNVALEAIDRLKVTASSLRRAFLVEVMGREFGYLAIMSGITGGAEAIVIPEIETDPDEVAAELQSAYDGGDQFFINPEECIDCGACEPECPVEAIYPEDDVPDDMQSYITKAEDFFE